MANSAGSATCSHCSHKDVYLTIQIVPYLWPGMLFVSLRVMRVFALGGPKGSLFFFQFLCHEARPGKAGILRRKFHFCPKSPQNFNFLPACSFLHTDDGTILFYCCNERNPDSSIARSTLNNRSAGFKPSLALCSLNHIQRCPVLYASTRVESLDFGVNICLKLFCFFNFIQMQQRRIADQL